MFFSMISDFPRFIHQIDLLILANSNKQWSDVNEFDGFNFLSVLLCPVFIEFHSKCYIDFKLFYNSTSTLLSLSDIKSVTSMC